MYGITSYRSFPKRSHTRIDDVMKGMLRSADCNKKFLADESLYQLKRFSFPNLSHYSCTPLSPGTLGTTPLKIPRVFLALLGEINGLRCPKSKHVKDKAHDGFV